jgi:hypothetical protein
MSALGVAEEGSLFVELCSARAKGSNIWRSPRGFKRGKLKMSRMLWEEVDGMMEKHAEKWKLDGKEGRHTPRPASAYSGLRQQLFGGAHQGSTCSTAP